jgi:hypothetical protein
LKVEAWEFEKKKHFKVFGTSKSPFGGFRGLWGCEIHLSFNICSGYSLQSFFASKAGKKRISASIPQPLGRKSLFSFYQSGD